VAPHNAHWAASQRGVVELVEGTFRGSRVQSRVVVHVSIAQGTASDRIAAHADGGHRANLRKHLEKLCFGDIAIKVTNVQAGVVGGGIARGRGRSRSRSSWRGASRRLNRGCNSRGRHVVVFPSTNFLYQATCRAGRDGWCRVVVFFLAGRKLLGCTFPFLF
jgi:hypothetical protein